MGGIPSDDNDDINIEYSILLMYKKCVENWGWSLNDIDDTNFETLMDFLLFKDPNLRVIDGKKYKRATKPPSWL